MTSTSRDLSHIQSLKDLQREINQVKAGLIVQEAALQERRKLLPQAAKHYAIQRLLPATIKKVVPFVLTGGAVSKVFGFVRNAIGLVSVLKKSKQKGIKNTLLNTVKKAGAAAAAKGVMAWLKSRKQHHPSSQKIVVP